MSIVLPTKKVKAERVNPKRLIIYSKPKTGKTTAFAGLEDNLLIDLENGSDYVDALKIKVSSLQELLEAGKAINITNTNPSHWNTHIRSMCDAWLRDIYPTVPLGGTSEFKFSTQVGMLDDYELHFEGTMDYFHQESIWDWKTAARKYYQAEKQTQNIQEGAEGRKGGGGQTAAQLAECLRPACGRSARVRVGQSQGGRPAHCGWCPPGRSPRG